MTVTINQISIQSGRHLKSKVDTLLRLVNGHSVQLNNVTTSTNGNPEAEAFCCNLIARKLVVSFHRRLLSGVTFLSVSYTFILIGQEQADAAVSANYAAAFPFACVIIGLMNSSARMKDLILGHFYIVCPYLIPHYPGRESSNQPTDKYYRYAPLPSRNHVLS